MVKINSLIEDLKDWAIAHEDIYVIFLVGSHARGKAKEDSDVDVVILTERPNRYLDNPMFIYGFGAVVWMEKEYWGRVTSIRAFYEDGMEVEFGLTKPDWVSFPLDQGTERTLRDGYKIIFTRDKNLEKTLNIFVKQEESLKVEN